MATVKTDSRHYSDIAAKIRERAETSRQYKPSEMSDGIDSACSKTYENGYEYGYAEGHTLGISEGYDAGAQNEYEKFWDDFQDRGTRTDYMWVFRYWGGEYIRPKYKIQNITGRTDSFFQSSKVKKIEAVYFDFTGIEIKNNNDLGYAAFNACRNLEEIEDINMPAVNYYGTFYNCPVLRKVAAVRFAAGKTVNSNTFLNCSALEDVMFSGTLATNGLDLQYSPRLSHDSIVSVINILSESAGAMTVTLSIAAVNKAFETSPGANDGSTSAEWAALIAEKSNWTISLSTGG